jgi:hypothetical protein
LRWHRQRFDALIPPGDRRIQVTARVEKLKLRLPGSLRDLIKPHEHNIEIVDLPSNDSPDWFRALASGNITLASSACEKLGRVAEISCRVLTTAKGILLQPNAFLIWVLRVEVDG